MCRPGVGVPSVGGQGRGGGGKKKYVLKGGRCESMDRDTAHRRTNKKECGSVTWREQENKTSISEVVWVFWQTTRFWGKELDSGKSPDLGKSLELGRSPNFWQTCRFQAKVHILANV